MGQAFTISDELLPYTYNARNVPGARGLDKDHINKVGFVVVGLSHALESNQWTTSIRANMIFLKNKTEFQGELTKLNNAPVPFSGESSGTQQTIVGGNTVGFIQDTPWSAAFISYVMQRAGVDFPSNAAHVEYLNSLENNSNFELLDPAKNKIQIGDVVVFNRAGNNQTFTSKPYSGFSHGDIIVSISNNTAEGIGGNVSNTVFKSTFFLNNRRITNKDVFVVLRPKQKIQDIVNAAKYEYNEWNSNKWKETTAQALPKLKLYYKTVNINLA
jgi:hypothetical protein